VLTAKEDAHVNAEDSRLWEVHDIYMRKYWMVVLGEPSYCEGKVIYKLNMQTR